MRCCCVYQLQKLDILYFASFVKYEVIMVILLSFTLYIRKLSYWQNKNCVSLRIISKIYKLKKRKIFS